MTVEGKYGELETVSKWDGESCVASLEGLDDASSRVEKSLVSSVINELRDSHFKELSSHCACARVAEFIQVLHLHGYGTVHLRATRGNGVGFVPVIGEWLGEVDRVGDLKFKGPMQEIVAKQWTEFICEVPAEREVCADVTNPMMLGFYSEECVSHRSSSAEIAQMPGLLEAPTIPCALYLNGKITTGTWRKYEGTLACRIRYRELE